MYYYTIYPIAINLGEVIVNTCAKVFSKKRAIFLKLLNSKNLEVRVKTNCGVTISWPHSEAIFVNENFISVRNGSKIHTKFLIDR